MEAVYCGTHSLDRSILKGISQHKMRKIWKNCPLQKGDGGKG